MRSLGLALLLVSECLNPAPTAPDGGPGATPAADAPPGSPPPVADAPPGPPPAPGSLAVTVLGAGHVFLDASIDQGGNVWGVTADQVWFFRDGGGPGLTFDQANGLAHGQRTWTDTYWFGTPTSPSAQPVTFSAVAGGMAGEAFVGNIGYIGDRLQIDPASGTVELVEGLAVTSIQQPKPDELVAQQQREVATWHAVVDLNGSLGGTTYFGGWHGTSALHGMTLPRSSSTCGCYDYEEHVHAFSPDGNDVYGGDVHGLALTPAGDLWIADRKALYFLPQGSLGPDPDLFQPISVPGRPDLTALDVFPGVDDWSYGIALDAAGGIYVASYGNGLAYLAPGTYAPTFFTLPTQYLTGVDIDAAGTVWIATKSSGVLRYTPASGFTQYTAATGLPSDRVHQVAVDRQGGTGAVVFATDNGIAVHAGP